jgi:hypothetical protein
MLQEHVDGYDKSVDKKQREPITTAFLEKAVRRNKSMKYFDWHTVVTSGRVAELAVPDIMRDEANRYNKNEKLVKQLMDMADTMCAVELLVAPCPEVRPGGMTEDDIVQAMQYISELKRFYATLGEGDGVRATQLLEKYIKMTTPSGKAGEFAVTKKEEWQVGIQTLLETWSKNATENSKTLSDAIKPALANLFSQLYTIKQLGALMPDDSCVALGEVLMNAVGTLESNTMYESLMKGPAIRGKLGNAVLCHLGLQTTAWNEFCLNTNPQRRNLFITACPKLGAADAASIDLWIQDHFDKFLAMVTEYKTMYESQMEPLKTQLQDYITKAYHLEGKAFLAAFTTKSLKDMSPQHSKLQSILKHMRDSKVHFGLEWDLKVWDEFSTKCRCLSVKWALHTLSERP